MGALEQRQNKVTFNIVHTLLVAMDVRELMIFLIPTHCNLVSHGQTAIFVQGHYCFQHKHPA